VDGCPVLDRPNVALVMLLEPLVSSDDGRRRHSCSSPSQTACICVANTHLLYNPGRGDVKLAQLMFLFAAVDELAGISAEPCPDYRPVILCGDFNLEPFSPLYDFIVGGSLRYEGLPIKEMSGQQDYYCSRRLNSHQFLAPKVDVTDFCQFFDVSQHRRKLSRRRHQWRSRDESFCSGNVRHALNLESAYNDRRPQALTTWLGRCSSAAHVDYIFYSAAHAAGDRCTSRNRLTVKNVLQLPTQAEVRQSGGLPNCRQSSDHLMLMASFILCTYF